MSLNRPLVITGVSSFVGSHLAVYFRRKGHPVVGLHSKTMDCYEGSQRERLEMARTAGVRLVAMDITDKDALTGLIGSEKPAHWVHHAGWVKDYVGWNYDERKAHQINVAPLDFLFPALAENRCESLLLTGSSMEYGDGPSAHRENEAAQPSTPYGYSKLCATLRAGQLAARYSLPTRVARLFIPYGSLDSPLKVLASAVASLKANIPIALSPCEQSRDFLFVDDVVKGYDALLRHAGQGSLFEIFNVCAGVATPLRFLLLKIADILKADSSLLKFGEKEMRAGEFPVCFGANDKAKDFLNWEPHSLEQGLTAFLEDR